MAFKLSPPVDQIWGFQTFGIFLVLTHGDFPGLPQVHEGFSQAGDVFVHAPGLRLSMAPERRVSPHAVQQCRTPRPWQRSL